MCEIQTFSHIVLSLNEVYETEYYDYETKPSHLQVITININPVRLSVHPVRPGPSTLSICPIYPIRLSALSIPPVCPSPNPSVRPSHLTVRGAFLRC